MIKKIPIVVCLEVPESRSPLNSHKPDPEQLSVLSISGVANTDIFTAFFCATGRVCPCIPGELCRIEPITDERSLTQQF